ncbi:MAG TPA: 6-carboxytetrahydropterin synthase [Blastocatellia bacterium]|nr:6-carboxytetrahydropterin synthase [Blastocatellia bacterium]
MFEIGVIDEFEAAHSLAGDFGPATMLHGHTYRVEVRVEAPEIDETGTFYDIGRLRRDLRAALDELHYRNLNEVAAFAGANTTAETVARYIFSRMEPQLRDASAASLKVTVWESPSVFAAYKERFD